MFSTQADNCIPICWYFWHICIWTLYWKSIKLVYQVKGEEENQLFVSDFCRLLRHAIEKARGPILHSKTRGPWWPWIAILSHFPNKWILHLRSLVQTCDPRDWAIFDPKGHYMNKTDKGLQGDATYQESKLYSFQFQRRILKLVFFVPMFQLVIPGVGSVLTPKESNE